MTINKFGIQINTTKDRANAVLHCAALSTVAAGVICCTDPSAIVIGLAASFLSTQWMAKKDSGKTYLTTPAEDWNEASEAFPKATNLISEILGAKNPRLRLRTSETALMAYITEYGSGDAVISVSESLLSTFDFREQTAIAAHELGHLAAGHFDIRRVLFATREYIWAVTYTNLMGSIFKNLYDMPIYSPGNITNIANFSLSISLPIIGAAVVASLLRKQEFQADRIAAEVLNAARSDPQALLKGLHKIADVSDGMGFVYRPTDITKGSMITRMFKRARLLFLSHPSDNKRYERIANISKKLKAQRANSLQ